MFSPTCDEDEDDEEEEGDDDDVWEQIQAAERFAHARWVLCLQVSGARGQQINTTHTAHRQPLEHVTINLMSREGALLVLITLFHQIPPSKAIPKCDLVYVFCDGVLHLLLHTFVKFFW